MEIFLLLLLLFVLFIAIIMQTIFFLQTNAKLQELKNAQNELKSLIYQRHRADQPAPQLPSQPQTIVLQAQPLPPVLQTNHTPSPIPQAIPKVMERQPAALNTHKNQTSAVWKWFCGGEEAEKDNLSKEYTTATTWLIRGGVLILLAGLGLLIQLSFGRGWFSPGIRIGGIAAIGLIAAVAGIYFAKGRFRQLLLTLAGGGFALTFFAIFGGWRFYALYSQGTAFMMIVPLTIITMAASWYRNGLIVAVIGCIGGYFAPHYLPAGEVSLFPLLWITIFNIGGIALAHFKKWSFLQIFSLLLYGVSMAYFTIEIPVQQGIFVAIVCINYICSALPVLLQKKADQEEKTPAVYFLYNIFNLLICLLLALPTAAKLKEATSLNINAIVTLVALTVNSCCLWKNFPTVSKRNLFIVTETLCTVFVCGTLLGEAESWYLSAALAVSAVALAVSARKLNSALTFVTGLFPLLGAFLALPLVERAANVSYPEKLLENILSFAVFGVSVILCGVNCWKISDGDQRKKIPFLGGLLCYAGSIFLFLYLSMEMYNALGEYLPNFQLGGLSVWWGILAVLMLTFGICKRIMPLRISAIILFMLTCIKIILMDMAGVDGLWRIAAFCSVGALLLLAAMLYIRQKETFRKQ